MTKAVFKFNFDCGRQGELEGLFVSTKEEVQALIKSKVVDIVEKHNLENGYNPFEYEVLGDYGGMEVSEYVKNYINKEL